MNKKKSNCSFLFIKQCVVFITVQGNQVVTHAPVTTKEMPFKEINIRNIFIKWFVPKRGTNPSKLKKIVLDTNTVTKPMLNPKKNSCKIDQQKDTFYSRLWVCFLRLFTMILCLTNIQLQNEK